MKSCFALLLGTFLVLTTSIDVYGQLMYDGAINSSFGCVSHLNEINTDNYISSETFAMNKQYNSVSPFSSYPNLKKDRNSTHSSGKSLLLDPSYRINDRTSSLGFTQYNPWKTIGEIALTGVAAFSIYALITVLQGEVDLVESAYCGVFFMGLATLFLAW